MPLNQQVVNYYRNPEELKNGIKAFKNVQLRMVYEKCVYLH